MKLSARRYLLSSFALFACLVQNTFAEAPKYAADVPDALITPDLVQTDYLGELGFFDGMPDPATVRTTFENLKFIRAYETFLTLMPAASIEMLRHGHTGIGVDDHTKVALLAPLYSNPLFLTGNTDTIYGSTFFNLKETGPLVIEIPAGLGPGRPDTSELGPGPDASGPGPGPDASICWPINQAL